MKIGLDAFRRAFKLRFDSQYRKAHKVLGVDRLFWHELNIGQS